MKVFPPMDTPPYPPPPPWLGAPDVISIEIPCRQYLLTHQKI